MTNNKTKCFFCNDTEDIVIEIGVPFCRDERACLARQKQQAKERAAEQARRFDKVTNQRG